MLCGLAAWPLTAQTQQSERMRLIGALLPIATDNQETPPRIAAFTDGLQEFGWIDGRNVHINYRWTGFDGTAGGVPGSQTVLDDLGVDGHPTALRLLGESGK